jgi:hypothetical protein
MTPFDSFTIFLNAQEVPEVAERQVLAIHELLLAEIKEGP